VNVAMKIREQLAALEPLSLDLVDESAQHPGHAGAAPGGQTHWRLSIVSPRFAGQPRWRAIAWSTRRSAA
jgi:BolA protein